jgi:hypothetical protein
MVYLGFRIQKLEAMTKKRFAACIFFCFFVIMGERMTSYKWKLTCTREPNVSMKRRKGAFWAEEEPSKGGLEGLVDHLELGPEVGV